MGLTACKSLELNLFDFLRCLGVDPSSTLSSAYTHTRSRARQRWKGGGHSTSLVAPAGALLHPPDRWQPRCPRRCNPTFASADAAGYPVDGFFYGDGFNTVHQQIKGLATMLLPMRKHHMLQFTVAAVICSDANSWRQLYRSYSKEQQQFESAAAGRSPHSVRSIESPLCVPCSV